MVKLFEQYTIKDMTLKNRIVLSPMCQFCAGKASLVDDWHVVHYATRAVGGVGLIIVEATGVQFNGRITEACLGIWDDKFILGFKKIVDLGHQLGAKVGIQLSHAGRKSGVPGLEVGPSAIAVSDGSPVPRELSVADIKEIVLAFRDGAKRAFQAGFDMLEIHGAHGYLLHQFLSPISNQRQDDYGGDFSNRVRFMVEVLDAVRSVWPLDKPLFLRLSAVDHLADGIQLEDTIEIAKIAKAHGVDLIDVSSGGLVQAPIALAPGYQVPYAEAVRKGADIPTAAVGLITSPEMAEEIVFNGRADLVAIGRELLRNPYWPLRAAKQLGVDVQWPEQYLRAKL